MPNQIIKTADLIGPALDYAVAIASGWSRYPFDSAEHGRIWHTNGRVFGPVMWVSEYKPSTNQHQGGLIIDQEGIDTYCNLVGKPNHPDPAWRESSWRARYARMGVGTEMSYGKTRLVAAMRCYVAFKIGEVVAIPEEFLTQ